MTGITINKTPDGRTRVEFLVEEKCVSWLDIVHFTISVGSARLRMDGIANVNTFEEHRMKGYSRRVLEAAIDHTTRSDAAISMLYGIRDFYPKFGYATAGPDHLVILTNLDQNNELPAGWSVRPFTSDDLPAVRNLYYQSVSQATGASVRPGEDETWSKLLKPAGTLKGNDCRVIVGSDGKIHGYAWLAQWCYAIDEIFLELFPDSLCIGETVADSPRSADALLAACRLWAKEEGTARNIKQVTLFVPEDTCLAAAAMYQDARIVRDFEGCGGSMVRVLDVRRLLESLAPEIRARLDSSRHFSYTGRLTFRTDIGDASLVIEPDNIRIENTPEKPEGPVIDMPQTALGRLALGAYPPEDILARLPEKPDELTTKLLKTIFPLRHPHMHLPDRY